MVHGRGLGCSTTRYATDSTITIWLLVWDNFGWDALLHGIDVMVAYGRTTTACLLLNLRREGQCRLRSYHQLLLLADTIFKGGFVVRVVARCWGHSLKQRLWCGQGRFAAPRASLGTGCLMCLCPENLLGLQFIYRYLELLGARWRAGLLGGDFHGRWINFAVTIIMTIRASSRLLKIYCRGSNHTKLLLLILGTIRRVGIDYVGIDWCNWCLLLTGVVLLTVLILMGA